MKQRSRDARAHRKEVVQRKHNQTEQELALQRMVENAEELYDEPEQLIDNQTKG